MARRGNPFASTDAPARLLGSWKMDHAIGVVAPSYGTEKVSYGLAPPGYTFHKLLRVPLHRFEKHGTFWHTTPLLLDHPVELVHTFNELPLGLRPFVVSFENELPRYLGEPPAWQVDFGYARLESVRCRSILALSDAAAMGLRNRLVERGLGSVAAKVCVFRGAVLRAPAAEADESRRGGVDPLRVLFVGRDAFGKGLLPTLDAIDACRAQGAAIETTVVCNFELRHYISKGRDADSSQTLQRMRAMPGLTYHAQLPNAEIHGLMQSHDVLVFPTLDESLGWVAIEAAMAGMPVITTDVFALPELVQDGRTGVLIPLERNHTGRWAGLWQEGIEFDAQVARTFASIRSGVEQALLGFADNPRRIAAMGSAAKVHIDSLYGFAAAQRQLAGIYGAAIAA